MSQPEVVVVAGLVYGDEGKGTITDAFVRKLGARTVVRYSGAAQAAHNVVTNHGLHHTFQQFGAGTFAGADTFLSEHVLVNPINLLYEARALADKEVSEPLGRVSIDSRARIITPFHVAANRLRELARGESRHGSCGEGVGETASDWLACPTEMISAAALRLSPKILREKLLRVRAIKREHLQLVLAHLRQPVFGPPSRRAVDEAEMMLGDDVVVDLCVERYGQIAPRVVDGEAHLDRALAAGPVVFEGAQGVLLDEWRGFHPYTTWSTTTFEHALGMLLPRGVAPRRVGVLRTYATRHGPGPFVTESAGSPHDSCGEHNQQGPWQGRFRVGHLDLPAVRYAAAACGGLDEVALTHVDRLRDTNPVCVGYENLRGLRFEPSEDRDLGRQEALTRALFEATPVYEKKSAHEIPKLVEGFAGAPVRLLSYGPRARDKSWT